jgi:dTDP-4-amino-4,6-dideoxygalactose transaminase
MSGPVRTSALALRGGPKSVHCDFRCYNPIGREEARAASEVIESGVLSQFLGVWHDDFYGGPKVRQFERACADYFGVQHAVTVNSWTSGLIAAVGAIGIEPGDEVIVSPWTMSASATAILHWNAIPVFADIEPRTFCLDPASVEANITPYTRAIMTVDIFGHPSNTDALNAVARRHGLKVITDTAQSPGARYHGRLAGTLTDVGGYSLNYHKHIHTGEGGILVTNDDTLAERVRLIRNHAEAVVGPKGVTDLRNMVGHNFRLGEIECAIGIEQLKKLEGFVASRQRAAQRLTGGLRGLTGLRTPIVEDGCTHVYYIYPMILDSASLGVPRARIAEALRAEGVVGLATAYQNIHLLPIYQERIAYGSRGFPWTAEFCRRQVDYRKGICPVAEELQDVSYMGLALCMFEFNDDEIEALVTAFRKVWDNLEELR